MLDYTRDLSTSLIDLVYEKARFGERQPFSRLHITEELSRVLQSDVAQFIFRNERHKIFFTE